MSAPKIIIKITEPNKANVIIKPADAVLSEQYRNEALAFRNQAAGFASQTQADAVQTALDRVQTGLDVISTGEDRVQTGADRVQTGLDAQATADDRNQTGLDAIATAADRVQTGLDVIAANEAKDDAESAADAVANNVDFTGTTENDLLQADALGVFVPKSPTLVNQSLTPFLNSPAYYAMNGVSIWDNFNGKVSGSAVAISDSGHTWVDIVGNGFQIEQNIARAKTAGNISGILIENKPAFATANLSYKIYGSIGSRSAVIDNFGFAYIKDSSNYIYAELHRTGALKIFTVIAGVETERLSQLLNIAATTNNFFWASLNMEFSVFMTTTRKTCVVNFPEINQKAELNFDSFSPFVDASEINYAGIISKSGSFSSYVENFNFKQYRQVFA